MMTPVGTPSRKEYADDKIYGHCNGALPNMKEITEKDFARSTFFSYTPEYIGYRQISSESMLAAGLTPDKTQNGRPTITRCQFYVFYNGTGIGMSHDYWGGKVRYFSFAVCDHVYRDPNETDFANGCPRPARCFHVSVCTKCDFVSVVDSSD